MQLMYPWFLVGLLGVAIPVIIHLLQLRRPQRVIFTNTSFIREVELVAVRHRSVQRWLVLLARIAAVAALVLVFCQPFVPVKRDVAGLAGKGIAVVVDNTFSMQQQSAERRTLLEEAVLDAGRLGKSAAEGERISLRNSGRASLTKVAYQGKLDELKFSARGISAAMSGVSEGENRGSSSLYVFSDFQKNAFDGARLNKLSENKEVVLVPLAGPRAGNVYVDSVWLDDAFVRVRTNVGLHVRLRNGGSLAVSDCPVKVFLGSRQVAAFRVTVGPGQAATSLVQVQVNDGAVALGRVTTEDVPVTFDNAYYFTMQPAAAIRVLEIGAEPVAQQLYGNEPLFTYSFAKPQRLDYGVLRQANLVVVREVGTVDAGLRDGLRAVLKRGGSVVVVPAALASAHASYQQLFRDLGLGTVQWEAPVATPELREVAMPNAREPFFREVFGAQQRAVTMPRAAPVLRWSRTGTDILRMRDGESYLAGFTSGAGRVYVFAAPFTGAYSDFTAHALFVPVLYRMAMLSYRNEQQPAYRLTQATLTLKLPAGAESAAGRTDEAGLRLVKDSLTLLPAQRVTGSEVRLEMPAGLAQPGFYQLQRRGQVLTTLAFNPDKRESELAAYSASELRTLIGPNRPNVRVLEAGADGASLARFRAEQTGQPLWRYFLALALLALLAEALLVRFGGARGRQGKPRLAV